MMSWSLSFSHHRELDTDEGDARFEKANGRTFG